MRAPRRLKARPPAVGSSGTADLEPGGAPALELPDRLPRSVFARYEQPPRVVSAGPTMADLAKRVDGVYAKKVALLISPDYEGARWAKIAGVDEALSSLKGGLRRWGFKEADIHLERGQIKADALRERIDSFVREENAAYSTERNLVLVYFLGHVYRRDENDSGLLITSDSALPRRLWSPSQHRYDEAPQRETLGEPPVCHPLTTEKGLPAAECEHRLG